MSTTTNDDPMGAEYWAQFETAHRHVEAERSKRNSLYGGCDPATWGWRQLTREELAAWRERGRLRTSGSDEPAPPEHE